MTKYINNGKSYKVESITYLGMFINVNGTTITDCALQKQYLKLPFGDGKGFTVFCNHDELYFDTFEKAYNFAMTKQKNTFRLEN